MDTKFVFELMDRFQNSTIEQMELDTQGFRVKLSKRASETFCDSNRSVREASNSFISNGIVSVKDSQQLDLSLNNSTDEGVASKDIVEVKAIVAGTFYTAPSPDASPFVTVGQNVKKGDVIGLIEAMKMMNDITSPCDGQIVEIKAANEDLVGFDDVLISIKIGG